MTQSVFVGGLPYSTTQAELTKLFTPYGKVVSAKVLVDRETGRSRGLAFVELASEEQARDAMRKLDGSEFGGRKLFVKPARPQERPGEGRPGPGDAGPGIVYGSGPGMTDRRKGKDRRQNPNGSSTAPAFSSKPRFEGKPRWEKKPWSKKPFGDKPGFGGPKKWGDKPKWEKKPWDKRPGDKPSFGGPKKWGDKPAWSKKPAGDKPDWSKKPGTPPRRKEWGAAGPNPGQKPGQFRRKPAFRKPR